jgi:7,8-dihydro-6-hydroxymethylpterin-pyrophosphokinase
MLPPINVTAVKELIHQCIDTGQYRMSRTLIQDVANATEHQHTQAAALVKAAQEITQLLEHVQALEAELAAIKKSKWPVFNFLRKGRA